MNCSNLNIENYAIVYASQTPGLNASAEYLQKKLFDITGCTLAVYADTDTAVTSNEILIGCTNRSESPEFTELMKYKLSFKNRKILLECGGQFSANHVIDIFSSSLESNNIKEASGSLLDIEKEPLTVGSDLRVMTSNILAQRWICGGRPYITIRAEIYAAILAAYAPDIIGVQETDDPWNDFFPYYLAILRERYGLNYAWTCNRYGNLSILTSILYNKNKYNLIEDNMREFSYMNSEKYKLRVLSSAILEDIDNSTLYLIVNTHWSGDKKDVDAQIKEGIEVVDYYKSKYGVRNFFCTGDFNMHMNLGFEQYKTETGYLDAKELAEASDTLVNHNSGIREGIYIDHVFHNPELKVLRYETIDKNHTDILSDHLPQYGDFCVK